MKWVHDLLSLETGGRVTLWLISIGCNPGRKINAKKKDWSDASHDFSRNFCIISSYPNKNFDSKWLKMKFSQQELTEVNQKQVSGQKAYFYTKLITSEKFPLWRSFKIMPAPAGIWGKDYVK